MTRLLLGGRTGHGPGKSGLHLCLGNRPSAHESTWGYRFGDLRASELYPCCTHMVTICKCMLSLCMHLYVSTYVCIDMYIYTLYMQAYIQNSKPHYLLSKCQCHYPAAEEPVLSDVQQRVHDHTDRKNRNRSRPQSSLPHSPPA